MPAASSSRLLASLCLALAWWEAPGTEEPNWWGTAHVQISVWDQSWLTPRLVCGLRFLRLSVAAENGGAGAIILHLTDADDASGGAHEAEGRPGGRSAGGSAQLPTIQWAFDGTQFQQQALDFFAGIGAPPMGGAWLLHLLSSVPKRADMIPVADLLELNCSAVTHLAQYLYAEYLVPLVPPSVLLKVFQHSWRLRARTGLHESAEELATQQLLFQPIPSAVQSLERALAARTLQEGSGDTGRAGKAGLGDGKRAGQLRADVVITRCREDLAWLFSWLARVLRDEWTSEVPGVRIRLLVFERCEADAIAGRTSGWQIVQRLRRLGAVEPSSAPIPLPEPPGFENVGYVQYMRNASWRDTDFAFFLHGSPYDHLDAQTLDDVLRAMAQGAYAVQFVQLNAKRTPQARLEPCLRDLLLPALDAWAAGEPGSGRSAPNAALGPTPPQLPEDLATYCCSQFVAARQRLAAVPPVFWETVWHAMQQRSSVGGRLLGSQPASCEASAARIFEMHHHHGGGAAADFGLWAVALERTWHWLLGEPALLPLRERDERLPLFLRVARARATAEGGPRGSVEDRTLLPDWGYDPGLWGAPTPVADVLGTSTLPAVTAVPTGDLVRASRELWRTPSWLQAWLLEGDEG